MRCTTRCAANGQPPSQATQHRRSPGERPLVGREPHEMSAPAEPVLGPRPFGFRRYEPICGAAEPGRESRISTRNLHLAYRLQASALRSLGAPVEARATAQRLLSVTRLATAAAPAGLDQGSPN